VYWASSCGGFEIAIVNLHEKLLKLAEQFELILCPCLMDTKRADVEAMADASITVTLFNGSIRTEENEEMAHLLRRKSQLLVAYGFEADDVATFSENLSTDVHRAVPEVVKGVMQ
jgi:F420-non-reducing hydrogenase small subunit